MTVGILLGLWLCSRNEFEALLLIQLPRPGNRSSECLTIPQNKSRRNFLRTTAVAAAASTLTAQQADAAAGSNERLRIGFIGPGGRGFGAHVKKLCGLHADGRKIDLVGVAEVYENQRNKVAGYIKDKTGTDPGRYVDYGEMIEKENLDAVCIGTPDHWHHKPNDRCTQRRSSRLL